MNRVRAYFDSAGDSLLRELSAEREAASAALAFEDAAAIHARVEKLYPIISQLPEIVQRLDKLFALMIQPSHIAGSVAFFRVECGTIAGPDSVRHSIHGTRKVSVHGIARTGVPGFLSTRDSKVRNGNHGAHRPAQALVLPQQPAPAKSSSPTPKANCPCAAWFAASRGCSAARSRKWKSTTKDRKEPAQNASSVSSASSVVKSDFVLCVPCVLCG